MIELIPYRRLFRRVILCKDIFILLTALQNPGGSINTPSDFTQVFTLHENIDSMRVVILSAGELHTISKNNLREITLGIKSLLRINYLILRLLSVFNTYGHLTISEYTQTTTTTETCRTLLKKFLVSSRIL